MLELSRSMGPSGQVSHYGQKARGFSVDLVCVGTSLLCAVVCLVILILALVMVMVAEFICRFGSGQ